MSTEPLTEPERFVLSGVIPLSCNSLLKNYGKRTGNMTPARDMQAKVRACYSEAKKKAYDHCGEELSEILACNAVKDSPVRKCDALLHKFERCYVRNLSAAM